MTSKEKYRVKAVTRRQVLEATVAGTALVAAPAFLRHALAADPIKIGIPTVITGGYAILGSQVQRTCRLVKKMTDAKGGVIGRPIEFLFQDTQGDPAMCVRKSQELVERDNCRIRGRADFARQPRRQCRCSPRRWRPRGARLDVQHHDLRAQESARRAGRRQLEAR